ncbi:27919_t:CDS:2 [Dentiscutata erythropus]|uniref:27919_t:CDS:1 n=1 Tax=Dentiscutata erythropus TaxID=1348616 RepID=A0A9N9FDV3_9GLOM|nr:27919_t:CDS:2 [Dentiscutata erythropus]
MGDVHNLRIDMISDCRQRAIVSKEPDLDHSQTFKSICNTVINNRILTEQEKVYLINDLIIIRDSQNVIENIGEKRQCKYCNNQVIAFLYCEFCIRNYLKERFSKWNTGDDKLDKLIRVCQLNAVSPSNIIEWIPYEEFTDVQKITKGGFSIIYTAIWKKGPYKMWDFEQQELKRGDEGTYILKTLESLEKSFKEIETSITVEPFYQSLVRCYGLTRDPETKNFMLILQKMDFDLKQFLCKNPEIDWKIKFKMVRNISNSVRKLHNKGKIHKDLHLKNILVNKYKHHCVVSDFGLCGRPISELEIEGKKQDIINRTQSEYPDYADLMNKCWDENPGNRPDAKTIMNKMEDFLREIYKFDGVDRELKLIPIISKQSRKWEFLKNYVRKIIRKWRVLKNIIKSFQVIEPLTRSIRTDPSLPLEQDEQSISDNASSISEQEKKYSVDGISDQGLFLEPLVPENNGSQHIIQNENTSEEESNLINDYYILLK